MAWHGMMAWRGTARRGMAWHGMAWHGMAWHGMAWHGMAWYGMAWHGGRQTRSINQFYCSHIHTHATPCLLHDLGMVSKTGQGLQAAGQRQEYATEHTGRDPTPPLWWFHSRRQIRNSVKTASPSRTRVLECLRPSQETDRRPWSCTNSTFVHDV